MSRCLSLNLPPPIFHHVNPDSTSPSSLPLFGSLFFPSPPRPQSMTLTTLPEILLITYPHTPCTPTFLSAIPSPCSPCSPPHPALPATLLPGPNVFLSLSYTVFTHSPSPSTYSSIPHTLGPADPLREEVGELRVGNNTVAVGPAVWLIH